MVKEDAPILVRYKYETSDADGDLVCELTEFMDKYYGTDFGSKDSTTVDDLSNDQLFGDSQ